MKKGFLSLIVGIVAVVILTGCNAFKAYTFKVTTGDNITVQMNTSNGYNLTGKTPIEFSKNNEVISQGSFAISTVFDTYKDTIVKAGATIIKEDERNDVQYVFYKYENTKGNFTEYDYIMKIKNTNTCFVLANKISQESAEEVFNRLKFRKR